MNGMTSHLSQRGNLSLYRLLLWCFRAVKANPTSPRSGLGQKGIADFVAKAVSFKVSLPRGYTGGSLTQQQCQ